MSRDNSRVMVDIETLGTNPGAVIVSIGAVKFGNGTEKETFYRSVDLQTATEAGLEVDGDTIEWWIENNKHNQAQLIGGDPIAEVLAAFNGFVNGAEELWANSPSFDLAIIDRAMRTVGIEPTWEFYQERDFRTLKNLPGKPYVSRDGDKHHAVADAEHQAKVAEIMLQKYNDTIEARE